MQTVRDIADEIVAREGGFVNDPDDPGGPTKHGVTLSTLRRLGLDLTGDGQVGLEDLHAVTPDRAADLFIAEYYEAPGISALPAALQASVFDMYVNAGAQAVRLLQRLLREMGYAVAVDGLIGPQTVAAATDAGQPDATLLRDAYGIARRSYYLRLADRRPASRKFARTRRGGKGGWIRRAEEFLSPRFHMSVPEFEDRVASWG